jgi:hypothetical protein
VNSPLFSDATLTQEVAGALGQIEHIANVKFFTGVRQGVVILNGDVGDVALRSQAERFAASIPGVRGVLNHIRIRGVTQNPEALRFLQPKINMQIHFSDGPSGTVQKVVVNPSNRLVVAMIVQGLFRMSPEPPRSMKSEKSPSKRAIVIPTHEIRHLTEQSGFLNIRSVDTSRFGDFDPEDFVLPDKNWIPSFPYQLEDVLFPAKSQGTMDSTGEDPSTEASFLREQV